MLLLPLLLLPLQDDPSLAEVPLEAHAGWRASLVLDVGETGVWCVRAFDVFETYATPELVGLDDAGRCHVLVGYSGKWTPLSRVHDGKWLGCAAHDDVDPRADGRELYVAGQGGNVYQLRAYPHGALDARLVAHLPGREVHTLLAGDLDPRQPGRELLAFTRPGGLFRLAPTAADGAFETAFLGELPGRVREALVLPDGRIATVSRDGHLRLVSLTRSGLRSEVLHEESMGMGRIARRDDAGPTVLYLTLDDGRVLRLEESSNGWTSETIYAGAQGPRGLVSGRFTEDPADECVAVFGYSGRVQLLTRRADGPWSVETIFSDRDRGHWLEAAELDGRNGTDELVASGYSGRIVLIARPPGYGRSPVATDPDDGERPR